MTTEKAMKNARACAVYAGKLAASNAPWGEVLSEIQEAIEWAKIADKQATTISK